VAEWYSVTRKLRDGTSSFSVIGYPFSFMRHSPHGDPDEVLRYFPGYQAEEQNEIRWKQTTGADGLEYYDLVLKRFVREDEEVFEPGWYLSGIGHHLMWCAVSLEDAVDAAQEHIACDGQDPMSMTRLPFNPDRPYAIPEPESVWQDDSLWFGYFTGKWATDEWKNRMA
jgi:hypothetical protein